MEARVFGVEGAKADADASMRKERAPVSFMLDYSEVFIGGRNMAQSNCIPCGD